LNSAESDFSTQERVFLLRNAFSAYRKNWLFGEGLGATWTMGSGQRTHNIYLEKAIEMGVIGLLLWPAFLLLLVFSCQGQSRQLAWILLSSGLVLGLFSHNLFESRQILIAAALLLVMSTNKQPR
jgi:O-antigen ligase